MPRLPILLMQGILLAVIPFFFTFGQNQNYVKNTENGAVPGRNNTLVGYQSGLSLTNSSSRNIFLGTLSGFNSKLVENTILIGNKAGYSLEKGRYHIVLGDSAGYSMLSATTRDGQIAPFQANIYIGAKAGASEANQYGSSNVFIGHEAGSNSPDHNMGNVYIGNNAGHEAAGWENTFIGFSSGYASNAGSNTYIGSSAGSGNRTGDANVFVGRNAGQFSTENGGTRSARMSVSTGFSAGQYSSGENNVYVGYSAGMGYWQTSTGSENIAVGSASGYTLTTGERNTFVGTNSGRQATTGSGNVFLGAGAGHRNETGWANVFVGSEAGSQNLGRWNTYVGSGAGSSIEGFHNANTFIGTNTGCYASGHQNVAIGFEALFSIKEGRRNVAVGHRAARGSGIPDYGYSNTVIVGDSAGYRNRGNDNVFLGQQAGAGNTSGSANTYLGFAARGIGKNAVALRNATTIGANALVGVSNGFVLGDTTNTNVGIGTAYPNQRLTIRGNMNFLTASNLRFDNSPFLDINQNRLALGGEKGEFPVEITSSLRYKVASEDQWADHVLAPAFRKLPLREVASFIQQNGHLPGIPSAREVVKSGVDAAQMDARLLSQIEQLMLYAIEQKTENEILKNENQRLKENQQQLQGQLNKILDRLEKLEARR